MSTWAGRGSVGRLDTLMIASENATRLINQLVAYNLNNFNAKQNHLPFLLCVLLCLPL
jgi:hypothetical protein